MLLICQSVFAASRGSQPSLTATVACGGTPPVTPQRCDGATFSMNWSAALRCSSVSSGLA